MWYETFAIYPHFLLWPNDMFVYFKTHLTGSVKNFAKIVWLSVQGKGKHGFVNEIIKFRNDISETKRVWQNFYPIGYWENWSNNFRASYHDVGLEETVRLEIKSSRFAMCSGPCPSDVRFQVISISSGGNDEVPAPNILVRW